MLPSSADLGLVSRVVDHLRRRPAISHHENVLYTADIVHFVVVAVDVGVWRRHRRQRHQHCESMLVSDWMNRSLLVERHITLLTRSCRIAHYATNLHPCQPFALPLAAREPTRRCCVLRHAAQLLGQENVSISRGWSLTAPDLGVQPTRPLRISRPALP